VHDVRFSVLHPAPSDVHARRAVRVFNTLRLLALVAVIALFVAAIR
jgi:hypothetical protein